MNQREQRPTRSGTLTENPAGASTDMVSAATVTGQEARRRRDRIKLLLTSMTEQTNKVVAILEEAQTNEDHLALGYASWTAYIAGEYAGLLAELTRANRREVVGSLTSAGMPTRAIAEIVGVDQALWSAIRSRWCRVHHLIVKTVLIVKSIVGLPAGMGSPTRSPASPWSSRRSRAGVHCRISTGTRCMTSTRPFGA
jgi:hypothetical protein